MSKSLLVRFSMVLSLAFVVACGDDDPAPSTTDTEVTDTGNDTPMGDTPMEDTPMGDTPMEDTPMGDTPMEDTNHDVPTDDVEGDADPSDTTEDTVTPAESNLCTNEPDLAILGDEENDVTADAQECGLGCLGDDDARACSVTCIVEASGISEPCAGCYGDVVACSIANCLAPCSSDPSGEECGTCQAEFCLDDFYVCTGIFPPPVDQCTNEADLAIIDNEAVDVTGEAQRCGLGCLGEDDARACSVTCIIDATDVTAGCAGCYGDIVACSIENCLSPCSSDPDGEECGTCQAENCLDDFYSCTGLPTASSGCTDSGGTVAVASCCEGTAAFPNTCDIGACGCAEDASEEIEVCECPEGSCYDGESCVAAE